MCRLEIALYARQGKSRNSTRELRCGKVWHSWLCVVGVAVQGAPNGLTVSRLWICSALRAFGLACVATFASLCGGFSMSLEACGSSRCQEIWVCIYFDVYVAQSVLGMAFSSGRCAVVIYKTYQNMLSIHVPSQR